MSERLGRPPKKVVTTPADNVQYLCSIVKWVAENLEHIERHGGKLEQLHKLRLELLNAVKAVEEPDDSSGDGKERT